MRYGLMVVVVLAGLGSLPGQAQACPEERLVQKWYLRYLHRPADPCGLESWARALRCGTPPVCVEAAILGSDEYYCAHGHCPRGFVIGLYEDVLRRTPCPHDVHYWVCRLKRCGCRTKLAKEFLCAARGELAARPAPPAYGPFEPPVGVSIRLRHARY